MFVKAILYYPFQQFRKTRQHRHWSIITNIDAVIRLIYRSNLTYCNKCSGRQERPLLKDLSEKLQEFPFVVVLEFPNSYRLS